MLTSLKLLLTSTVDYAGLFPPAQLSLSEAAATYNQAQGSPYAWMLDRFVVPAARLQELDKLLFAGSGAMASAQPWSLSVILSKNWAAELEQIRQGYESVPLGEYQRLRQVYIGAWEIAPLPPAEIQQIYLNLPAETDAFFEIPWDAELEPYLQVLQQTGTAAKLRTGGMTPQAFPDSGALSQRILSLAAAQIPFKATAGLHHALRGHYRLTDAPDSPATRMQGFLNLAILAAFAFQHSITQAEAKAMLEEQSIAPFQFTETAIIWRDRSLSLSQIQQARQKGFHSWGSCSFQEPIDHLHQLGLL